MNFINLEYIKNENNKLQDDCNRMHNLEVFGSWSHYSQQVKYKKKQILLK